MGNYSRGHARTRARARSSDRPIVACVLAGGSGSRLYPLSRPDRPKQFLEFGIEFEVDANCDDGSCDDGDSSFDSTDTGSLLERTLERARRASDHQYVLTTETLASGVRERVPDVPLLIEPEPAGTGPALVYAAWRLTAISEEPPVLVILPSDHHVEDDAAFAEALERAAAVALETAGLVTLGVEPTRPATGFGYVLPEGDLAAEAFTPVADFREKPDRETAVSLIEAGASWNAGIFAWTPESLLETARDSPLAPLVDALEAGVDPTEAFATVDPVSVDEAILERTDNAVVTPLSVGWDDLGTWDALGRISSVDGESNASIGETDVLALEAAGNVVAAPGKQVSLVGVDDLVVAVVDDRVLVAPRSDADRIGAVADRLREGK
ncbi:mannose-1-phosphate guanylyltransferase [Natrialbaceae archaeon A-CW3]